MSGSEITITCTVTCGNCCTVLSEAGRHVRDDFPDYRGWVYKQSATGHCYYICPRCATFPDD